jgi:hypothetical protein
MKPMRAGNEQPEGATQPLGEPKVGNPDLNAVDDAGIQDRINAFPATDDPEGEFRAIDKQINRKARANLNKEDRSQLSKKAPLLGNDEAVQAGNDVMKAKLNAKNSVVNDSIGRRQQNLLPAEGYNDAGAPTAPTRGAPRSVTQQVDTSAVDDQGVNDRIESLKGLGDDEAFQEAGRIRGSIESKLSSLNKGRKKTYKRNLEQEIALPMMLLQDKIKGRQELLNTTPVVRLKRSEVKRFNQHPQQLRIVRINLKKIKLNSHKTENSEVHLNQNLILLNQRCSMHSLGNQLLDLRKLLRNQKNSKEVMLKIHIPKHKG